MTTASACRVDPGGTVGRRWPSCRFWCCWCCRPSTRPGKRVGVRSASTTSAIWRLAMIHYESTYGSFPPAVPSCSPAAYNTLGREQGVDCVGPNWAMQILSQMEDEALYEHVLACVLYPVACV